MSVISAAPAGRLAAFYFFYFTLTGAMVPYWPLYLHDRHFSPADIGILTAILMGTRIVAPNFWGWLADISGRRMSIIRFGTLTAFLCLAVIFLHPSALWLACVIGAFSFFWNATLAQFEVVTLGHLATNTQLYGRIRLWGSVGFIVMVAGLGYLFEWLSIQNLPLIMLCCVLCTWLSSLCVSSPEHVWHAAAQSDTGFFKVLQRPEVIAFLIICFLLQFSHGSYYTFFSVYLEHIGYSRGHIGLLWTLGVAAEILLFWFMQTILAYWNLRLLMLISLALTSLRWMMIAFYPQQLFLLLFAQCLHAFSFGTTHAVSIELVRRFFPDRLAGRGQALYSSISYGLGGACGALASGFLWDINPVLAWCSASMASLAAFIVAWRMLQPASLGMSSNEIN